MKTEHLSHFAIAGFSYYDGALAMSKLKVGKKVELQLEENNKFDPKAVAIYLGKAKLGYVPKSENSLIYKLLKIEFNQILRATIQKVDAREHPENQVMVVIHLVY